MDGAFSCPFDSMVVGVCFIYRRLHAARIAGARIVYGCVIVLIMLFRPASSAPLTPLRPPPPKKKRKRKKEKKNKSL